MEQFEYYYPTKVHFGKKQLAQLPATIKSYGSKVLLVYGENSIFDNGIYDTVTHILQENNIQYDDYRGIKSNPRIANVNKAAAIGRNFGAEVVLAIGGGSVIDSAKLISVSIPQEIDAWDFMIGKSIPQKAVPLITILTLAATGSEMNSIAVISNHKVHKKQPIRHPLLAPRHSFLNPEFTFSVNQEYTAYGITDIIAHALEAYFGSGDSPLSDKFIFAIIQEMLEIAHPLLNNLNNYQLRARMMYAATNALNGLTLNGKKAGDWGVHALGHILSLLYDTPHGASLSIMYPAWMNCKLDTIREPLIRLGEVIFGETEPKMIIEKFSTFFVSINSPIRLAEAGISLDEIPKIRQTMIENKVNGWVYSISDENIDCILNYSK